MIIGGSILSARVAAASAAQSVVGDAPWDGSALAGPSFDVASPETVVVSVGSSAYLGCRVRQLGDRKVSFTHSSRLVPSRPE